jgi:flagellar basal body rod protein FlgB
MELNISSIVALQDFNNNSASNIANVNTNHYRPTNTVIEESSVGSVKAISSKADDNGSSLSQTNLVKEITDQIVIENTTFYNVAAIRVQDTIIGTLLDIKV